VLSPAETRAPEIQGVLPGKSFWLANPRARVLVFLVCLTVGTVNARAVDMAAKGLTEPVEEICPIG